MWLHNFKNKKIKFKHSDDYLQSTFSFKKWKETEKKNQKEGKKQFQVLFLGFSKPLLLVVFGNF